MRNFLMISCKKATYLLSKKEEGKLTLLDKLRLRGHLTICSWCRRFEQQGLFIGKNAPHTHEHHTHHTLSAESRQRIIELLEKES